MTAKSKKEPQSLYFLGIKGVAVSGLAIMAKQLGYTVRGSDVGEVFITDELLKKAGIPFFDTFEASHIKSNKPDLLIVGTAFGETNPEYKAAKSLRIPIMTQSEMLGKIMANYEGIGVAGTHGKTTTTSMLAVILKEAGFSPSYAIGTSSITGLEGNAHLGDGKYFIAEADDYKKSETSNVPKFMDLPLKHLIVTSIELDHPDMYPSVEHVYQAFYNLSVKIPRDGMVVACTDWPLVRRLTSRFVDRSVLSYGFESTAQYQIIDYQQNVDTTFKIKNGETVLGPFELLLPGKHNVLNATAAIVLASKLGVDESVIRKALAKFVGPKRRFERLGSYNGAEFYDDYAHHPTALTYLFETAKKRFPTKRIIAVFQPHTYSRTGKLLKEFAHSLQAPDKLILLNIFASAREKSGYVTIKDLVDETKKLKPDTEYRSSLDEVAIYLRSLVTSKDVVLLVGAGDVYKIYQKLQELSADS